MKTTWTGALTAMACALTMTLAAQTPPAGGAQAPAAGAQDDNKMTITGCLERAQAATATTGTTGGAASAAADVKFVLKQATAGSGGAAGAAEPTGTTGGKKMASSYNLAGEDAKLTPHVGHKIEITGTMHKAMGAGAGQSDPQGAAPTGAMAVPTLKVESVKMVSAECEK